MFSKELFSMLPNWFFTIAAILMLAGIGIAVWWVVLGAKRFQDTMNRETKVIELKDDVSLLKSKIQIHENLAMQLKTSFVNCQNLLSEIIEVFYSQDPRIQLDEAYELLQRTVDAISSDMKSNPGDRHRCGIWMEGESPKSLILVKGSSEFPRNTIGHRELKLDFSIAGKAFRQGRTIHIPNLTLESDWTPNPDSNFEYTSMIAVPIKRFGVLTIDAIKPLPQDIVCIAETYTKALEFLFLIISLGNEEEEQSSE